MIQRKNSKSADRSNSKSSRKKARNGLGQKRRMRVENLESRQLLAASLGLPTGSTAQLDDNLFADRAPRNIGTVSAFIHNEQEGASSRGANDSRFSGEFVPLGTGSGQEDTIDINGSLLFSQNAGGTFQADVDTYAFDLRAGDILDIAVQGSSSNLTMNFANGALWFGTDANIGVNDTDASPLMTVGNAVAAQVVPEDGRYYLTVAPTFGTGPYQVGLRVYRPVAESLPVGAQQTIYLDFEGGNYSAVQFPSSALFPFGLIRFSTLRENIGTLGIEDGDEASYNRLVDSIVSQVESNYQTVADNGGNGDFDLSGLPGEFGVKILNSRDAVDRGLYSVPSFDDPLVTRVLIGGTEQDTGQPPNGVSPSIDIGNFDMSELVIVQPEAILAQATVFPIANTSSVLDAAGRFLGVVASHEAGHSFGLWHQDGGNGVADVMDVGLRRDELRLGVGPDLTFGTLDDTPIGFTRDRFDPGLPLIGYQNNAAALAHSLSTGTVGSSITGTVFSDANSDGNGTGDAGIAGVTVFADLDNDGVVDATEPKAVTNALGNYALYTAPGNYRIRAVAPDQYAPSTAAVVTAGSGASNVDFGLTKVVADITGIVFADANGNGVNDTTEGGVNGVYIYLDLDGDDRPDLGEPSARSGADGQYDIDFPGPGTYTVRAVVEPGYVLTYPVGGEHVVTFDGTAISENANFGLLPSRDFGDAPGSYSTTVAQGGPSHGISDALGLGAQVDREINGFPSVDALGDDDNNIDDEDGVQLISPLGPGGTATFAVTTRNTTNSDAFLQGWIDFDGNGVFGSNEQVFTNVALGAGTTNLTVNVPAGAAIGSTYARFRYSPTAGLGIGGNADVGEVEDYQFDILEAASVANDDEFTVSRNSLSNQLDVLANDFQTSVTQLSIIQLNTAGTSGSASISQGGNAVSYTPPNGFTGRDVFQYVVQDLAGNRYTANVAVNVNFQSNVPIAVDDTFDVPQGSANRALNVLDNDVPSLAGGLSITSVTAGDQGGQVSLEGGGQTIRYTPQPGFAGTEQFVYTVEDANGTFSSAQVTVNSQPGAQADDLVDFTIGLYDVTNNQPISSVQVGQPFFVRVFVEELNNPAFSDEGVASAFLDLLYTDALVSTNDTGIGDLDFDIKFGPNFQGSGFQLGDATTPGLIDEVGAVQPIGGFDLIEHSDPAELFTITMTAVSPGIALFAADPADSPVAETILVGEDFALTPAQQRLGRTELTIFPAGDDFASAIDDAFVAGVDSNGTVISSNNAPNVLDVLNNDNFGPTGSIQEFGIVTSPARGDVTINNNGTPNDLSDDTIEYYADVDASGFDSFTYLIVSNDGVRSIAEVTMAIGDADADDVVEISFGAVDQFGNPVTSVASGDTFGVQVFVEDLRSISDGNTFVFAGFLDMLYDTGVVNPASVPAGGRYDFDVTFGDDFITSAGSGTAIRPGIVDEFGTLMKDDVANTGNVDEPNLLATVYFNAESVASATTTQIVGSPADAQPFQDTLLFGSGDAVSVSQIRYNVLDLTITPAGARQNTALPEDVNADGLVTPSDALTIINTLARSGEGESSASGFFTDVNGDSKTTTIDALRVINHLALQVAQRQAEGESVAIAPLTSQSSDSDESARQEAFAEFNQAAKLVTVDSSEQALADPLSSASAADADDDDDDLLALLADDQGGLG